MWARWPATTLACPSRSSVRLVPVHSLIPGPAAGCLGDPWHDTLATSTRHSLPKLNSYIFPAAIASTDPRCQLACRDDRIGRPIEPPSPVTPSSSRFWPHAAIHFPSLSSNSCQNLLQRPVTTPKPDPGVAGSASLWPAQLPAVCL